MISYVGKSFVFPVREIAILKGLCICLNCGKIFVEHPLTNDHGICSLDCGYAYRGISWSDFL